MNTPRIAVIVASRDAQSTMEKCLDSLLALDYPDYEVIVVDDGSKDKTAQILERYNSRIRIMTTAGVGPSAARNLAARQTSASYIAFTDSDCIVDKQWLRELMRGLNECPQAVACGGRQELPAEAADFEKKVFLFMRKARLVSDYVRLASGQAIIRVSHTSTRIHRGISA